MVNVKKNVKLEAAAHFAQKAAVISMLLVQLLLQNFALTAVAEVVVLWQSLILPCYYEFCYNRLSISNRRAATNTAAARWKRWMYETLELHLTVAGLETRVAVKDAWGLAAGPLQLQYRLLCCYSSCYYKFCYNSGCRSNHTAAAQRTQWMFGIQQIHNSTLRK